MSKVVAGITTSVDGYVAGPDDGPGKGLGEGGERLHYWVFGGPWSYDADPSGEMLPEDKAWLDEAMGRLGAVVGGRATYEAADHWSDKNPWGLPFFIVTHRPEEQPPGNHFTFVNGVPEAIEQAKAAAGTKDRARRRADDHHRPADPRPRQASLRRVRARRGARAPRREAVPVRDVHRLPRAPVTVVGLRRAGGRESGRGTSRGRSGSCRSLRRPGSCSDMARAARSCRSRARGPGRGASLCCSCRD
jgi:dihydrofolate reductase